MTIKPSRTIFRNSILGFTAQTIIKVLSFLFSIYIIRYLGVESFGQYSAILAFTGTFAIFSDLGLSLYSTRQIARWRDEPEGKQKSAALYTNILFLRLILAILTVFSAIATALITHRSMIIIMGIALSSMILILYAVQGSSEAVLAGFERLDITSGARIINQVVFVMAGGILLWLGVGYFGLITANLLGVIIMGIFCWFAVKALRLKFVKPTPSEWFRLLRFSIPFGIIGFALGLSYKFDTVLLNIFRGDKETGYYNAAYNLIFSFVVFSNVINTSIYPTLTRISINAPENLIAMYNRTLRYLMFISLPISVGITILADQIIRFLYTEDFTQSIIALRILIWVLPLMYASEFFGYIIVISNKEVKVARAVLISTGFNVMLNSILVPKYGYIVASIMTVITEMVLVGQYVFSLRSRKEGLDWINGILLPCCTAFLMGIVVYGFKTKFNLIGNVLIGVITYILLSFIFKIIGKEELLFVKQLILPSRRNSLL